MMSKPGAHADQARSKPSKTAFCTLTAIQSRIVTNNTDAVAETDDVVARKVLRNNSAGGVETLVENRDPAGGGQ